MVASFEGVEVEARSGSYVGRVNVEEGLRVGGVPLDSGAAVEVGDLDVVGEVTDGAESFGQGGPVESGVDLVGAGLGLAADDAGVEDAGSVGAIEVEEREPEVRVFAVPAR